MHNCIRFLLLAGFIPAAANSTSVPLTVRVSNGDPVQSVDLVGDTGVVPLTKSADGSQFTGTIAFQSAGFFSQQLTIKYSDFAYPAVLRVNEHLASVSFPIEAKLPTSCTDAKVASVESQATDLEDAITKAIQAARLASIEGNDSCDSPLRLRARMAKFRNVRRMAELSNGLFVIPDSLIAEYEALSNRVNVLEVRRYRTEAIELQGVQLSAQRDQAQKERDFDKAAAIQRTLATEAASSEETQKAFKNVGLTADRIATDSAYLSTITGGTKPPN